MGPLRAAIYSRISKAKSGKKSQSVEDQELDCRDLCELNGWTVVGEPFRDNGKTAADPNKARPAYDEMMKALAKGDFDVVVVTMTDRLHRQPDEIGQFVNAYLATGLSKIATVREGDYDIGNPNGLKAFRDAGSSAEREIGILKIRVIRKKRSLAETGEYGGGRRPFGYRVVEKHLVIDDFEAVLVKDAAERVLQGESFQSIKRDWNARPIPTTRGKSWSTTVIRGMLISPLMTGLRQYQGEVIGEANWPAIIDRDTHERLVAKLTAPERRTPAPSRTYVLRGILVCHECGHPLIATPRTRNGVSARNYSCRKDVHGCCGSVFVNAEAVEAVVLGAQLADSLHRNEDGRVVMHDAEGQRYDSIDENGGSARDWGWFCGATAFYGHRKDVTARIDWDSIEDEAQSSAGYAEWDYIINYGIGHGFIDLRSTGDGHYRQRTYTEPVETFPELES